MRGGVVTTTINFEEISCKRIKNARKTLVRAYYARI